MEFAAKLWCRVTVCELEYCSEEQARANLAGRDIVWVEGGACGYLLYWKKLYVLKDGEEERVV